MAKWLSRLLAVVTAVGIVWFYLWWRMEYGYLPGGGRYSPIVLVIPSLAMIFFSDWMAEMLPAISPRSFDHRLEGWTVALLGWLLLLFSAGLMLVIYTSQAQS